MSRNTEMLNRFNVFIIFSYILLVFFLLPVEHQKIADIIFIYISLILLCLTWYFKEKNGQEVLFKRSDLLLLVFLVITYALILLISEYSVTYITSNLLFLIIIIYYFYRDNFRINEDRNSIFYICIYWIMCLSLLFQFYLRLRNNEGWYLITTWDKNYSGVVLFLFFLYCDKNNYKLGKLIVLISTLFVGSRGFILMILSFYIIKAFKRIVFKIQNTFLFRKMFRVFIMMLVFIYYFSLLWVNNISATNVKPYQEGINDTSNRMRFVANIKAFELIKENRSILFYGYDNDLKKQLGIDSDDYSKHTRVAGVRLVQTHNSLLSIIIKMGILFSILYLLLVARIIDKYYTKENAEYIFPYLINSMIMHSMLNTSLLLFWILILHIPKKNVKLRLLLKQEKLSS
ncbi:hypothetical protein H839_17228 [Parageobacillus genomosp. 1]|uniref:O-antigen polymerase n=1 Tax=Parageobacillus genomosp. 1 TaxID=1295642 RepID=A0ABC9VAT6_9BACL|nr:hypothetical protein [Parageobacillus genomosp. 1]EZP75264.1 hypothetical protein H839_17228 [Parageobacillus genomosp. 1]